MRLKCSTVLLAVFGVTGALPPAAAMAQHNKDMWVGAYRGRLAWQSNAGLRPGSVYHPLDPLVDHPFLHGWSDNDPGFDYARNTITGITPLPAGASVWLKLIDRDLAFFTVGQSSEVLEFPGDEAYLGDENLHVHPTWFVDMQDPDFDPEQCVWEGTFRLTDHGAGLDDSAAFTLLFSNVPVRGGGFPPSPQEATGDFDGDLDVDHDDTRAFSVCINGPNRRTAPGDPEVTTCEVECHNAFDFNDDLDVDLLDFAEFQVSFDPFG